MRAIVARRILWVTTVTLCLVSAGTAQNNKNRERVYDAPFEKVLTACVQAASEKYVITNSEKASGALSLSRACPGKLTPMVWT
jgi:hypothetical protein